MNPNKVVCFGDSITFGEGVDLEHKWVTLLNNWSREHINADLEVINSGVSGDTAYMGLNRVVADLQVHEADLVTLQFGMNDCNFWLTDRGLPRSQADTFQSCLKEIISRARHFGAERIVLSTNHPSLRFMKMSNGNSYEQNNQTYNELIREISVSESCVLFDAHKHFDAANLTQLLLPEPDLLHLSKKGHQVYFEGIKKSVFA